MQKLNAKLNPLTRYTLMGGAGDDTLSGDASYINAALHGDDYLDGGVSAWGEARNDARYEYERRVA